MYTLVSGFYKYLVQKNEYCVLILGLDNAGKTVRYFCFNRYINIISTIYMSTLPMAIPSEY